MLRPGPAPWVIVVQYQISKSKWNTPIPSDATYSGMTVLQCFCTRGNLLQIFARAVCVEAPKILMFVCPSVRLWSVRHAFWSEPLLESKNEETFPFRAKTVKKWGLSRFDSRSQPMWYNKLYWYWYCVITKSGGGIYTEGLKGHLALRVSSSL